MLAAALRKLLARIFPASVHPEFSMSHFVPEAAPTLTSLQSGADFYAVAPSIVADGDLLERARKQWQLADWVSLASLNDESLVQHPDRARLALLAGAAKLQLGDRMGARSLLRQSAAWGCDERVVARILVAGVHNTLARVAVLMEAQEQRSLAHFRQAMDGAEASSRMAIHDRIAIETARLSKATPVRFTAFFGPARQAANRGSDARRVTEVPSSSVMAPIAPRGYSVPTVRKLVVHELGMGWASNTVNTVIFRHYGIVTDDDFQYTAFYVDDTVLRVVRRTLSTEAVEFHDVEGSYNLVDAHNSISLGVDSAGYLHMAYDQHGGLLRYRRSLHPTSIDAWSDELSMTGVAEHHVTYPCFIQGSPQAPRQPLMLLYRDGQWNKGTARINVYDTERTNWTVLQEAVLSGADQNPWTSNPYWNHPATGRDGSLHLSFVWRTDSIGEEARINNINIGYAKSLDGGVTWLTSRNQPYRLPITQVNAETIHPVSPGSNLINQCSMALDSEDRPHIVFYADDQNGIPQYQHVWLDGVQWRHRVISDRAGYFSLQGTGTLQIPISRPEILIDHEDQAFVLLRGYPTHGLMSVVKLCPPDYLFDARATTTLWDEDLGQAEPIVDRIRWQREQVLTMLIQYNYQPDGDRPADRRFSTVHLVDYRLS